jgi:predicted permease
MFASGIMLAGYKIEIDWKVIVSVLLKNIVQAALVLGVLLLLGYHTPIVPKAVLTVAIPAMPIVIVLAVQYRVAQAYATSVVFLSVIGSIFTMGAFIALTD